MRTAGTRGVLYCTHDGAFAIPSTIIRRLLEGLRRHELEIITHPTGSGERW